MFERSEGEIWNKISKFDKAGSGEGKIKSQHNL